MDMLIGCCILDPGLSSSMNELHKLFNMSCGFRLPDPLEYEAQVWFQVSYHIVSYLEILLSDEEFVGGGGCKHHSELVHLYLLPSDIPAEVVHV